MWLPSIHKDEHWKHWFFSKSNRNNNPAKTDSFAVPEHHIRISNVLFLKHFREDATTPSLPPFPLSCVFSFLLNKISHLLNYSPGVFLMPQTKRNPKRFLGRSSPSLVQSQKYYLPLLKRNYTRPANGKLERIILTSWIKTRNRIVQMEEAVDATSASHQQITLT